MKKLLIASLFLIGNSLAFAVQANIAIGQPAPDFSTVDTNGMSHTLSQHKGKYVVLEWVNPGCPFVRKHYSGNMQGTQKEATSRGVIWYTVNSTAEDQGDYKKPADMAAWMQDQQANATATLMDTEGKVGKAYGAKTTPHLYIIDPKGTLIYAGAIDSKATARVEDIKDATNYVKQALNEAQTGKPVSMAATQAYGCSVKY
ncbi:MAG TPA: redoxin domain-containing protein [Burkholderiales bacterium]|jgi:peroxiredoxin|nr:redoxin domain-containing protein [Burkholderiales bacterium]